MSSMASRSRAAGPARASARSARSQILHFKLDILWSMLDAIERAYPDDLAMELRP